MAKIYKVSQDYKNAKQGTIVTEIGEPSYDHWWADQMLDGRILPVRWMEDGKWHYADIPMAKLHSVTS